MKMTLCKWQLQDDCHGWWHASIGVFYIYIYNLKPTNKEIKISYIGSKTRANRVTQWRKFRKGGYKEKGGPIGTTPDRLVVTAVDCVISRNSFSLKFLSLDILVWWCHFLLIRFALRISESWQPFLLTVSKLETWHTPLSWQCFSDVTAVSWNRCLLSSLSLGILIFWHPFLLTPSSLDILFSPHPILLTRFSLGTIFLVSFCFHIVENPFC